MEWEAGLIEWLQANLSGFGALVKLLAFFGSEMGLLMLVLIVMFCWKKEAGQRLALVVSSLNTWLPMIKSVVLRPRPYMQYPDRIRAEALVEKGAAAQDVAAQGYSFPSMHSASIPALYFTLANQAKKEWLRILAAVMTVLVGVSRVVAGMHYPTDVMAGWLLGFAVIGVFSLLDRYVQEERLFHLILIVSALPGLFYVRTNDYFTSLGCLIGAAAAIHFERKYIKYQETRRVSAMILRMVGAIFVFFAVNTLLKLPFDRAFLAGTGLDSLLVRTARYAIILFLIMGVYPAIFPLFEKKEK